MPADRAAAAASRRLSYVLRHAPASIGVELDTQGWVDVEVLLAALASSGPSLTRAQLEHVVASNDKQRFAFSEDGRRIRASQGHSVPVDLGLAPLSPPAELFHGTVVSALPGIRARGLQPGGRHHVHLSSDRATARRVGARRGRPVLLVVAAGVMAAQGTPFFRSANGVWLVGHVPAAHLTVDGPSG